VPITDRVYLTTSANASESYAHNQQPTLFRSWGATALMKSFVSDHWQIGVSPTVDGFYDNLDGNRVGAGSTLIAVYAVNAPFHTLAFAGGSVSQSAQSNATPRYTSSWRVGLMRFLSPTAALRVEFRSDAWSSPSLGARNELYIIALDEYFDRHAAPMTDLPGWGIVDATVLANVILEPTDEQSYTITVAPFLTSWLQVGGHFDYFRLPSLLSAQTEEGFVRLYAPFSPALMPFIGGLIEAGTYSNDVPGLSSYSGSVGARHWIRRGLAVEGGVTLLQHRPNTVLFPGGPRIRPPNELSLFANVVLPLELRSHRAAP
jgi:hypothetical protein